MSEQPPYSIFMRGIERDVLPTCAALRHGRAAVEPARRWLAGGQVPPGADAAASSPRRAMPARFDLSTPDNQRKLDAVEALVELADEAGSR